MIAVKRRNICAVWLILPFVMFGIYGFFWVYRTHENLRWDHPGAGSVTGAHALAEAQDRSSATGHRVTFSQPVGILLAFLGFGGLYYQAELNKIAEEG
ncbi:DUF4234 domain-containing protein [Spirillospora sp. NPDC052269]